MVDPAVALSAFAALVALVALVLWPRYGVVARVGRALRVTERVLLEDALKHAYSCESIGRVCTLESLAGRLEISTARAASLLARLAESQLVRAGETGPELTDAGRESALRLVRTHRLWERYLADRTNVPAGEWHAEAERMEHALSPAEVEALAARLGHPAWDPHGDPIPTPGGTLPNVQPLTLLGVQPGQTVEIVHLEDEPREIYDALLQDGLALGARLDIVDRADHLVTVRANGREWPLSGVVAHNVTVRLLPEGEGADAPAETLLDLETGEAGRVVSISPVCQGAQRRRLLDLGVVTGTEIRAELVSALGDPVAYGIRGALVALRAEQAGWIRIERVASAKRVPA